MKRHLFENSVVSGKCRIDHGKIMLVGEVKEIYLHLPARLSIENLRIPRYLSWNCETTTHISLLWPGHLWAQAEPETVRKLVNQIFVEVDLRGAGQRIVSFGEGRKSRAANARAFLPSTTKLVGKTSR